jgi:uncharacterized protein (DUF58 family)
MTRLRRGYPAHVEKNDLRKCWSLSLSDSEQTRYAVAAQTRGMSLSEFFRMAADKFMEIKPSVLTAVEYAALLQEQDEAAEQADAKAAWLGEA